MSTAGPGPSAVAQQTSLSGEFGAAADEYKVPEELLLAMGYVNTRWEMPPPTASDYQQTELEGRGDYGVMALAQNPSRDTLSRAAALTGLSEEQLKADRASNVRGGAALLVDIQGANKPQDLNGWYDAVANYGDSQLYAQQVFQTLKDGASATTSTGEKLDLAPQPNAEPQRLFSAQAAADYPGATYYGAASSNYTVASRPPTIDKIVIHMTQGSWSSAINWFQNSSAGVSAHYTVRSSDGFIGQSVHNKDIAYHAGNWPYNQTSIGIEHEGFVSDPSWFTDAMYRSSARLAANLAKRYNIPIDRKHIVGHGEVPGATHTDPGKYWNWTKYMNYVKSYAGATAGAPKAAYQQTVDNATPGRFSASKSWIFSNFHSTTDYGKNYRVLKTPSASAGNAKWKIKIPTRGKYAIYARWPSDPGYSGRATFKVRYAGGTALRRFSQQTNGGRWMSLGSYQMIASDGWRVELSSQSTAKGFIIADAIRVVRY